MSKRGIRRSLLHACGILLVAAAMAGCSRTVAPESPAGVTIHPSTDLGEIWEMARDLSAQYGTDSVLVAFDLDNTLLAMNTELGADQWYDWQRDLQAEDACDPRLVSDRLAVQGALYHVGSMRPTQPDAADRVRQIQDAGIPTLLITARGHGFWLPTFRELRRNGMDFRASAPGPTGGFLQPYRPPDAARDVRFQDGAYLLAGQHKGDMLLALYERLGLTYPEVVLFADDKQKNVDAMKESLSRAGIRGEIFHYTREADRVAAFDEEQADADWQQIQDSLRQIEAVMGSGNYQLPEGRRPEGCS